MMLNVNGSILVLCALLGISIRAQLKTIVSHNSYLVAWNSKDQRFFYNYLSNLGKHSNSSFHCCSQRHKQLNISNLSLSCSLSVKSCNIQRSGSFKIKDIKIFKEEKKSLPSHDSMAAGFEIKEECGTARRAYKTTCCEYAFKIK